MNPARSIAPTLILVALGAIGCEDLSVRLKPEGIELGLEGEGSADETEALTEAVDAALAGASACGAEGATAFAIDELHLLIDPLAADHTWDWQYGGRSGVHGEAAALNARLLELASDDSPADPAELLWPLMDDFGDLLTAAEISPDPRVRWAGVGGGRWAWADGAAEADAHLLTYAGVSLQLPEADSSVLLELFDVDPVDEEPIGWVSLDRAALRRLAGCGPQILVWSDEAMELNDSRVRALALDVRGW